MSEYQMPDGVTVAINVYLVSAEGFEARVRTTLSGKAPFELQPPDVRKLVENIQIPKGSSWRLMSRAEIKAYEENDE